MEKNYLIEGQDLGKKGTVLQIKADNAWEGIKSYAQNVFPLSELKSFKNKDEGEIYNTELFAGKNLKDVVFKNGKRKEINNYELLDSLEVLNKRTNYKVFDVSIYKENALRIAFPYAIRDVVKTNAQGEEYNSSTTSISVPKAYKVFLKFEAEPINIICDNLTKSSVEDQIILAETEPEKTHYIEPPQVAKNLSRIVALLEEYPNVLPVLPAPIMNLPIIEEAFLKGKEKEGVLTSDLRFDKKPISVYDSKTQTYEKTNFKDYLTKTIKKNTKLAERSTNLLKNIKSELGKTLTTITLEDLGTALDEARNDVKEIMQKETLVPSFQKEKEEKQTSEVKTNNSQAKYEEIEDVNEEVENLENVPTM